MADIDLKNVQKSYGKTKVIHGIDWHINDGEFVVIVGPSGCGKSTLLRMIAGLESITGGEVSIGGRVVNNLEPAERDIAMVFQNYALYPHMTVRKNMAYGLKIKKIPTDEINRRVAKAADILELSEYLDRSPRQLSGGQRQRVAMGRAIVREPAVFLFDEPLSNLDAKLRVQMRLEIKKLQQDLGITSVYVTHDQVEAMTLGHRLAVLNGGYVEQLGTPIEIYEKPATTFVAGFIGSPAMNLLQVTISTDGAQALLADGTGIDLPQPRLELAGTAAILGIRPEHFKIGTADTHHMNMAVGVVEQLGADTLVHGAVGSSTNAIVARFEGVQKFAAGEDLPLQIPVNAVHLFDPETEARI
jgi:sn-glycerol 3-phosphate transport system ATP-binding protein